MTVLEVWMQEECSFSCGEKKIDALCGAVGTVLYIRKWETKIVFLTAMKKGRLLCCNIILAFDTTLISASFLPTPPHAKTTTIMHWALSVPGQIRSDQLQQCNSIKYIHYHASPKKILQPITAHCRAWNGENAESNHWDELLSRVSFSF